MGRLAPRWFDEGYASYAAGEWNRDDVLASSVVLALRGVPHFAALDTLISGGTVRAELPAPVSPEERAAYRTLKDRIYRGPDPAGADVPTHDLDEFHLVASWFRQHPGELPPAAADPAPGLTRTA